MSGLSPELQKLVDHAKSAHGPSAADRARVAQALTAKLAAPGTAAPPAAAKPWLHGLLLIGVIGGVTLSAAFLTDGTTPAVPPHPAPRAASRPEAPPAAVAEMPVADVPPAAEVSAAAVEPPPAVAPAPRTSAAPVVTTDAEPSANLREEARLIRAAETARQGGELTAALARLREHGQRFPRGVLSAEREATRVLVLCDMGQTAAARGIGGRFLEAHPSSPLAGRIRASCAGTQSP